MMIQDTSLLVQITSHDKRSAPDVKQHWDDVFQCAEQRTEGVHTALGDVLQLSR